jgi:ribose-phosphate pyrophosphokinase
MAKGREAISARAVATMLEAMGVSRVIYFDVHAPAIQGFFTVPVDPLSALPVLAAHLQEQAFIKDAIIVSPDVGRAKLADHYADMLGLPLAVMYKRRRNFEEAEVTHVAGDIKGKVPIVIDDVIAGGSVLESVKALLKAGAREEIYFSITHGVLLPSALKRLEHPAIRQLVVSDTIALPGRAQESPKITVVSVAELLAEAINRIHMGKSISSLIEKTLA